MGLIPHLFRCPISLDLFTDPVTLSTGQTYDRPSIEKWLLDGNTTCPVTMQRLHDTSLVPNRTLAHLIDQWLLSDPHPHLQQKSAGTGTGTAVSLAILKQNLQSTDSASTTTKLEILKKVRIVSTESDIGQACLIQLGYFPLLLEILFQNSTSMNINWDVIELVLDCVLSLISPLTQLDTLSKVCNLASFLQLLDQGNVRIKESLCQLLETIATSNATKELCLVLGQSQRVLQLVVSLLVHQESEAALRAISGICSVEQANRANAVREGAIDGLISYLSNSIGKNRLMALATLEILVGVDGGKKTLIENPNAIRVLVKSVFRVSSNEESEHAVEILMIVCGESSKARLEAMNAGVLSQVLLLLQSQCGSTAKAKARALLKLLSTMWARNPRVSCNFYSQN